MQYQVPLHTGVAFVVNASLNLAGQSPQWNI